MSTCRLVALMLAALWACLATATATATAAAYPSGRAAGPGQVAGAHRGTSESRGVRTGRLPNGLHYYIARDAAPGGKTDFKLIVRIGSAQSRPRELEPAHVLEHIIVANRPGADESGSLRSRLARFGSLDYHAVTGEDVTLYGFSLPENDPAAVTAGLALLGDWMRPRALTDAEIERERQAVIEEARRGSSASRALVTAQLRLLFAGIPAFAFSPDAPGTISAEPATIRALHQAWYRPSNMAITIVGDFDPDAVLADVRRRFGPLPRGAPPPPRADIASQRLAGGGYRTLAQAGGGETTVSLFFKYRPSTGDARLRARELAAAWIAEPLVRDAFARLAERYGATIRSGGITLSEDGLPMRATGRDMLRFHAIARAGGAREALADLLRLAHSIRTQGFAADEIERSRSALLARGEAASPGAVRSAAARWADAFARGYAEPTPDAVEAAAASMSVPEINAVLASWLDPSHRDFLIVFPDATGATIPDKATVRALAESTERAPPLVLASPPVVAPRLSPLDSAPVLDIAGVPEPGDYIRWTLPRSGATFLFRRRAGAAATLVMRGPDRLERGPAAAIAPAIAEASGLGGLDSFAYARFLASKGISVAPMGGSAVGGVRASGPASEWPLIVQLAREALLSPQCSEEAFRDYVSAREVEAYERDDNLAAEATFSAMIAAALGDPSASIEPSELREVRFADVCAALRTPGGAGPATVIAAEGDIAPHEAYRTVAAVFDVLPANPVAPIAFPTAKLIETRQGRQLLLRGKADAASVLLTIQRPPDDRVAGSIVGAILNQRIFVRLREVERGTYDPAAGVALREAPAGTAISISFRCSPENVDRLIAAARDELERLRSEGPSDAEIAGARRGVSLALSPYEAAGEWLRLGRLEAAGSPDDSDVQAWARRNLDPGGLAEFVLFPEN